MKDAIPFEKYNLEDLIERVKQLFENNKKAFYPYIEYIRFPKYKALKKDTKISFDFPLTVFVGENGTNKTSVIQALYCSPGYNSLGKYWFSTDVDSIDDGSGPQCLVYGYFHDGAQKNVEVLKTRVNRKGNLDYWEPSRPIKKYDMESPTPKDLENAGNSSRTRWDLISKPVVFYDNKEYVSAYDLCFYHSLFKKSAQYNSVQDFIRSRAIHLAKVIDEKSDNYQLRGVERVKSNKELPEDICAIISWIMNKQYKTIRIVEHSLYNRYHNSSSPAKTVYITCEDTLEYSEAFAGSGEARIILMLSDILNAKEKSLIVMDEPELSLHPGALEKLKLVLLWSILEKKHQIVVSTHSAALIRGLPSIAIKAFENSGGEVNVYENIPYKNAFSTIGQRLDERTIIFVEDELVKYIIEDYLTRNRDDLWRESIEIKVYPGGAENIIKTIINDMSKAQLDNVYYILDGDKNYYPYTDTAIHEEWLDNVVQKIDVNLIPDAENQNLQQIIKDMAGVDVKIEASGNSGHSNQDEKVKLQRDFLRFWKEHVFFLTDERCIPENAILGKEPEYDGKKYFVDYAKANCVGQIHSSDILVFQRQAIKGLSRDCSIYKHLDGLAFLNN